MDANKDHPLVLRVMRLTKPSIISSLPVSAEEQDFIPDTLGQCNKNLPELGAGELLMLPQSFGNIFLGETFVSYLSVNNESFMDVANVSLKADLQTGSQRMALTNTSPIPCLSPGNALDEVINHEVKELGTHILVCIVSYKKPDGEVRSFRKFFKFQVLKPLDVKTKFYNIECDEIYLETQIQNITQSPICLEKVNLDPSQMYTVTLLNSSGDNESIFGSHSYLKPSEIWQYLYLLKIKPSCRMQAFTEVAGATGKLDIVWKSSLGERGRLQTSQLQRAVPTACDVQLQVEAAPSEVTLNKRFCMKCIVTNFSERPKNLTIKYENMTNILWQGVSGYKLNSLASKESLSIDMDLLPVSPGLQVISGLKVIDAELNRTYDYDDIHQVLVLI